FRERGTEVKCFANIAMEPSFSLIKQTVEGLREFMPDTIVALGGGSVIDTAKTLRVLVNHPGTKIEEISRKLESPQKDALVRTLIAIPSTSGTGSEVTPFAVVIDDSINMKQVLISSALMPDVALLDPRVPSTMPPHVTADTGFDALSHAIESYVCTAADNFTSPYAIQATHLILENLGRCFLDGKNLETRGALHVASTLAGIAIANSAAGLAHRMDQIGPKFGLSHGRTLAILLPYVMQYNSKVCMERYACLARSVGLDGSTSRSLVEKLIKKINRLRTMLKIPNTLAEAGISSKEFESVVDDLCKDAVSGLSAEFNPRRLSVEDVKKVFRYAYVGKEVDF
ncbi:MAG: iron-containing alcohol dehydrogenase, partial [Candidatus Ranarchaeia archaeon]